MTQAFKKSFTQAITKTLQVFSGGGFSEIAEGPILPVMDVARFSTPIIMRPLTIYLNVPATNINMQWTFEGGSLVRDQIRQLDPEVVFSDSNTIIVWPRNILWKFDYFGVTAVSNANAKITITAPADDQFMSLSLGSTGVGATVSNISTLRYTNVVTQTYGGRLHWLMSNSGDITDDVRVFGRVVGYPLGIPHS